MNVLRLGVILSLAASLGFAAEPDSSEQDALLLLQPNRSPLVSFRILLASGSAFDPAGKEGLAALTAAMLAEGGSRERPYQAILDAMYPWATSFSAQVDKEMTVFIGTTHVDNLDKYYALIRQMLLEPGFREEDFTRLRTEAVNYLRVTLRESNDEELGKEQLLNLIYAQHPYGHHNLGTIRALEKLTIEDVRTFYRDQYRRGRITIGLAGAYPNGFPESVRKDFRRLPAGDPTPLTLPQPSVPSGLQVEIIQRETRSTAISLGFPIKVVRGDPDWPALALVTSYLGQHRSSNSHLFQRLREARGLNYGDYAYLEYFPGGMFRFEPEPNLARHQQVFQIWIRPVDPQNALFALRAALNEYDRLLRDGLSPEAFEATRQFLSKYVNVLLQTQDARLGYALDSRFYRMEAFDEYLPRALAKLTVSQVNEVIQKHLRPGQWQVVLVTKDAAALRDALLKNEASPMTYNSPKPPEILAEDKVIEKFPIPVKAEAVTIRPVAEVFQ